MANRREFIKISLYGAGILAAGAGTYKVIKALIEEGRRRNQKACF